MSTRKPVRRILDPKIRGKIFHVRFTDEEYERLQAHAKRTHNTVSGIVRAAALLYITGDLNPLRPSDDAWIEPYIRG